MRVSGGLGRCSYCKGVGAGFAKAAGYRGGGRVRLGSRSGLGEAAGNRDCSRVVEMLRVGSDSHWGWSARRRGWCSRAGYCHCR